MTTKKLGQEPAFPTSDLQMMPYRAGMSKRFYAACMAMQGIMSQYQFLGVNIYFRQQAAETAFKMADALLEEEAK